MKSAKLAIVKGFSKNWDGRNKLQHDKITTLEGNNCIFVNDYLITTLSSQ